MFYAKKKLPNGRTVKVEITEGNVFTRCVVCDAELQIDLDELLTDEESLYDTGIVCSACSLHYDFDAVTEAARNGLSPEELDKSIRSLGLPSDEEKAVREACKSRLTVKPQKKGADHE